MVFTSDIGNDIVVAPSVPTTTIMKPGMLISEPMPPPSMVNPPTMPSAARTRPTIVVIPIARRLLVHHVQHGTAATAVYRLPVLEDLRDDFVVRLGHDVRVPVHEHDVRVGRALHALDVLRVDIEVAVVEPGHADHQRAFLAP